MFNSHRYAYEIERILYKHSLASMNSAGEIERDPVAFIDVALNAYEGQDDEKQMRDISFWERYEHLKGTPMSSINEDTAQELVKDLRRLLG